MHSIRKFYTFAAMINVAAAAAAMPLARLPVQLVVEVAVRLAPKRGKQP